MTVRTALQALVDKLTAIEGDKSFQGIWTYLHVHGYEYTGPDWRDALDDARQALRADGESQDYRMDGSQKWQP